MPRRRSNWIWERSIRWQLIVGVGILQALLMTFFVVGVIRWQESSTAGSVPSTSVQLRQLVLAGLTYTLFSAGLGTLFAWLLARTILSPLRLLQDGVERFGADVLDQPVPITCSNEVAIVTRAFNVAMQRLAQQQRQLRDEISKREQTHKALGESCRAAEESNQAKDRFLAVLSHELRTPLTPMLTLSQMLERDFSLPESVREDITTIRRNVESEARLIDDLMDLTRIRRGKIEICVDEVNVHQTLRDVARNCQPEADAKKLDVTLELWADQANLRGDCKRLAQVFTNLLRNAIKFTPSGGRISIQTHREPHGMPRAGGEANFSTAQNDLGNDLLIEICDSGIGIEPAMIGRIFDEFEQGSREAKRVFGGLGLGLTISRALVQLHGGDLTVRSEGRDRGSTFTVRLPIKPAPARDANRDIPTTDDVVHRATPSEKNGHFASFKAHRRILLVEDHPDTSRATAYVLSKCGYDVQTASTIATAIRLTRDRHFDLIVSDIGLPDGTGHQLIRQLVAEAPTREMKGIAISGLSRDEDVRQSQEAGFLQHLVKPIDPETLIHSVKEALR